MMGSASASSLAQDGPLTAEDVADMRAGLARVAAAAEEAQGASDDQDRWTSIATQHIFGSTSAASASRAEAASMQNLLRDLTDREADIEASGSHLDAVNFLRNLVGDDDIHATLENAKLNDPVNAIQTIAGDSAADVARLASIGLPIVALVALGVGVLALLILRR